MAPRVEVIREPGVAATPRILVQLREDEPTFAMTVEEAHAYLDKELVLGGTCGGDSCAACMIADALQGLA